MKRPLLLLAAVTLFLMASDLRVARAQAEVTLLAPAGIKPVIEQLATGFETKTGTRVMVTFSPGISTPQKVANGEGLDVSVMFAPFPDALASGNIVPDSATVIARLLIGIAVQKGAAKPDLSTPAALKSTLLAAKSIAYPDPATGAGAGISFDETLKKLGIAEQTHAKITHTQGGGAAMVLVAKGDAEIGLTYINEMNQSGIEVVGSLPPDVSTPVDVTGFVSTHAKDPEAAKALLAYFSSPEVARIYDAAKVQPAH